MAEQRAPISHPVRLLLVDDNQEDRSLLQDLLDMVADQRFSIDWAADLASGRDQLAKGCFDACLVAQTLPDGEGMALLDMAALPERPVPMILLANHACRRLDRSAMDRGALGFLDKGKLDPTTLERTIRYAMRQQKRLSELSRAVLRDDETGLVKGELFRDRLKRALIFADRQKSQVAVMMINADRPQGSLAVQAKRLTSLLRKTDTVARLADRQLGVLLEGIRDAGDAALVARKMLIELALPILDAGEERMPKPAIGIALYPEERGQVDTLLRQADRAMRAALTAAQPDFYFACERLDVNRIERTALLSGDLQATLEKGALSLRYRPLIHLADTAISFSAEIVDQDTGRTLTPARDFSSIANDRRLIEKTIGWMLSTAISDLLTWQGLGFNQVNLSLPFPSTRGADLPMLEQALRRQLDGKSIDPRQLEIDLDQGLVDADLATGGCGLAALRATGVRLALDDFGRDGATIHHLTSDLIQSLKMSPGLYQDLPGDGMRETLLKAVISFGHDLNLLVVANGAQHEHQFAFLRKVGCDAIKLQAAGSSLTADMVASWLQHHEGPLWSDRHRLAGAMSSTTPAKGLGAPAMGLTSKPSLSPLDTH